MKIVRVRHSRDGFYLADGDRRYCVGCRIEMKLGEGDGRRKAAPATWLVKREGRFVIEVAYCDRHWEGEKLRRVG